MRDDPAGGAVDCSDYVGGCLGGAMGGTEPDELRSAERPGDPGSLRCPRSKQVLGGYGRARSHVDVDVIVGLDERR